MSQLNSIKRVFVQNYQKFAKLQKAHNISYQFKVNRPVYYPNRQAEMQRLTDQMKSQLVAEKSEKKLPRDYYYKILGVRKNASTQQIKTAYYALAKRFHPDASNTPQETKRFQEISNAYHILTDDKRRLEYDQSGKIPSEQNAQWKLPELDNTMTKKNFGPFILREELAHLTNTEPKLELSFLEAAHGMKKNMDLSFLKKCPVCNGKSARAIGRSQPELCRKCAGHGSITKKTATYTTMVICDQCQGKRFLHRYQCETCDNRGHVQETLKMVVRVPSGIKSGEVITVENPRTKKTISYRVIVKDSDYYRRIGNDVHTEQYMSICDAVLGATFKVRGIYEDMEVRIDPGTDSHTQKVLKGKGIRTRDGVGDHVIMFKVQIPRTLTMKQRQLILALAKTEDNHLHFSS